jgi:ABC-2 type transport system ATP-binding protein
MNATFELEGVTKTFDSTLALSGIGLRAGPGRVLGLVGRNGSGKTTLLRLLCGLTLPTRGSCRVLGRASQDLGPEELARIGVVHQESRFLPWMSVGQHLAYVASFYAGWDRAREQRLVDELDLDRHARIGTLSPGNVQKLALVSAMAHAPDLLLLDEPVSALDPVSREALLGALLELIQREGTTVVVSSHVLRDLERVVDWIVCLDHGRVVVDALLDDLRERFSEWRVLAVNGGLPARFTEGFVLVQEGDHHQARLLVRDAGDAQADFERRYHARIESAPLNLERMFPLWVGARGPGGPS